MGIKRMLPRYAVVVFLALLVGQIESQAEPWVDTRDAWLRADVERLAQAGVIKVPINTWPLMWGSIMNELEAADINTVPAALHGSLGRLILAGKDAVRANAPRQSIRVSAATESQTFRHFGDDSREELEFRVRRSGLTNHLAYNLEIAYSVDAWDGDNSYLDNSYFGFVLGNWVGLVGNVEKWWGPGWNSSIMLSNNARPTPGFTLHRNYSEPFELPVLKWLGPWTTNMFISKLDDERFINDAKLVGLTVGFRPIPAVEINLRRTAQWGGEGRPHGLKNFIKLVGGASDNCYTAECRVTEPGNQLAGFDLSWDLPWVDATVYGQKIGEDEHRLSPAKNARQVGIKLPFSSRWLDGVVFVEQDDTATGDPLARYNIFYNHSIYQTGYRYQGRVIGATWDNDSKVFSIGALGHLANGDKIEVRYSDGTINRDSLATAAATLHSVTNVGAEFTSLSGKWQRPFAWGEVQVEGRYRDKLVETFGRQEDKLRVSASLVYRFY